MTPLRRKRAEDLSSVAATVGEATTAIVIGSIQAAVRDHILSHSAPLSCF